MSIEAEVSVERGGLKKGTQGVDCLCLRCGTSKYHGAVSQDLT